MHALLLLTQTITGLWTGAIDAPDMPAPIAMELLVEEVDDDGRLHGCMAVDGDHSPLAGSFDAETGTLAFVTDFDDDDLIEVRLRTDGGDTLRGTVVKGAMQVPIEVTRSEGPPRFFHDAGFPLPEELPVTVVESSLEPELAERVERALLDRLASAHALGAATAIVRGGELVDVRCAGWEDLAAGVPATGRTRYRWASVSKPLTAVATLQLVDDGRLDLNGDVRELVPEFPDKGHTITPHQLLAHQAGILHFGNGTLVRTEREYDVLHPWADRILCLDLFRESPLIGVPGEHYSYSTFGYMLLGAVVARAAKRPFEDQVRTRILDPLGMRSTDPDYPWTDVPNRAVGYRGLRIGCGTLDEDLDVSWKLPAGGWTSTIGDLGRFAAGLLGGELLRPETQDLMFSSKIPADGRDPHYGYGVGSFVLDGVPVVAHSGDQSMASSYLLLCPAENLGVAVLSNTSNLETWRIGRSLFSILRR